MKDKFGRDLKVGDYIVTPGSSEVGWGSRLWFGRITKFTSQKVRFEIFNEKHYQKGIKDPYDCVIMDEQIIAAYLPKSEDEELEDSACPDCGADGGTQCGSINCGY